MEWVGSERVGRWTTTWEGRVLVAYRTPGRTRGWTLEIDGVPDEGLTGCCPRGPSSFRGVRAMLESVARCRILGAGLGRSGWAGP